MKSPIVLHMLKMTAEKLVLRAIKFKVSKSGADDCNVLQEQARPVDKGPDITG